MTIVPLHEAVRPNCHPDQAGEIGQNMHALADDIKKNAPELHITINDSATTDTQYWQSVVAELQRIRSIDKATFGLAINQITQLAQKEST
jgi:hypothetical protein